MAALRIGAGSGGAPDRVAPARDLAERGDLDYLCFEALAERTLAHGYVARRHGTGPGYNALLERRLEAVLPACRARGTKIITNMGSANPEAAGKATVALARNLGLFGLRVAVVEGDNVTHLLGPDTPLTEMGKTIGAYGASPIGANAYLGAEPIVTALWEGADIVITGRVADPSLFLAPMCHHYGWAADDWDRLGRGTAIGHLLECSTQVTGGYFADPGRKIVPNLAHLGYPLAEIAADGTAVITKLAGTGGCVTELTVKEQLLYEVHDPRAYLTPDVTADFSTLTIRTEAQDRIEVSNARGTARPSQLKVLVAFDGGYLAEGEMSYAGPGAQARAELARDIVRERMVEHFHYDGPLRLELIGVNSVHATGIGRTTDSQDVRLRAAIRTLDRTWAAILLEEVEGLWMAGPAGGGGYRGSITPSVITHPAFLDRALVKPNVRMLVS